MLVLSRKKDEQIVVNNNIVITVVEIRGDKIRLGFDAPKDIPIHRKEVYDAICRRQSGISSLRSIDDSELGERFLNCVIDDEMGKEKKLPNNL